MTLNDRFEADQMIQKRLYETLSLLIGYSVSLYRLTAAKAAAGEEENAQERLETAQRELEAAKGALGDLYQQLGLQEPSENRIVAIEGVSQGRIVFKIKSASADIGSWHRDPQTREESVEEGEPYPSSGPYSVYTEVRVPNSDEHYCGWRVWLDQLPESILVHVGLKD